VIKSAEGLTALIVGLKKEFSVGATSALYNMPCRPTGLRTKELYVINTGNGELAALEAGKGTVGGSNAFLNNIWTSSNIVKANAQLLIDNYQNVREDRHYGNDPRVYGHVYQSYGYRHAWPNIWESRYRPRWCAPTIFWPVSGPLVQKPRTDALQEAVDLLNAAAPIAEATTRHRPFSTLKWVPTSILKTRCMLF
jgi:hypothetical protein